MIEYPNTYKSAVNIVLRSRSLETAEQETKKDSVLFEEISNNYNKLYSMGRELEGNGFKNFYLDVKKGKYVLKEEMDTLTDIAHTEFGG